MGGGTQTPASHQVVIELTTTGKWGRLSLATATPQDSRNRQHMIAYLICYNIFLIQDPFRLRICCGLLWMVVMPLPTVVVFSQQIVTCVNEPLEV